jgi:hypothetical protein
MKRRNVLYLLTGVLMILSAMLLFYPVRDRVIEVVMGLMNNMGNAELWGSADKSFYEGLLRSLAIAGISFSALCVLLIRFSDYWLRMINPDDRRFVAITRHQPMIIILLVFTLYLVMSLFWIVHFHNDVVCLIVSVVVHIIATFVYLGKGYGRIGVIKHLLLCYGIVIVTMILSSFIYDYSIDGQHYHQPPAIAMSTGWNPYYDVHNDEGGWFWANHYPKFTWTWASLWTSITGNIECGKSYTMLFLVITFLYVLRYVGRYQKGRLAVLGISVMIVSNPLVFGQMFTYLVDGMMGMCIILIVFALIDYEHERRLSYLIMAGCLSVIAINLKFTGFVSGIVIVCYMVRWIVMKDYKGSIRLAILGVVILLTAVVVTGYNPYILNYVTHGHPFYPLWGENSYWFMEYFTPDYILGKNKIETFIGGFLFDVGNVRDIPFNPMKLQLESVGECWKIGTTKGFGVMLAEITILVILLVILTAKKSRVLTVLFPSLIVIGISFIFPENWHPRYIPYMWYGIMLLLVTVNLSRYKILTYVLAIYAAVNMLPFAPGIWIKGGIYTNSIQTFIQDIRSVKEEDVTILLTSTTTDKTAMERKLFQRGIKKTIRYTDEAREGMHKAYPMTQICGWY